jgi:Tfp pilus assembly protein PilF
MALFEQDDRTMPSAEGPAATPAAPKLHPQRRMAAGVCAALVLACVAVYGQTLWHGFLNFDDLLYVTDNPQVQSGLNLESVAWAFVTDRAMYFHPLTWMSHMLDCTLYGMHPWGHHLTNLVLHTSASVLLFLAFRTLTGAFWPSAAVAALFAVHPLHVESVAWVAERKDVLSALFWMLALGAYGLYSRCGGTLRYAAVTAAFVLGLMSKPMVVTLPFALLLLDYWPLGRVNRADPFGVMARKAARLSVEKIPLFLITAVSCASTFLMQSHSNNLSFGARVPFASRCANAAVVYVIYLVKTVWPSGLAVFYPHPITRPMWQVTGAVLTLSVITFFCLRHARRYPYLIVGWLWYLGTLVPVIELVQAGKFSHADRYTYLPSIGLFIMAAWGAADLAAAWHVPRRVVAVASGGGLVILTICAVVQTGYWRDNETLFNHAIAVGQESTHAYNILGGLDLGRGRRDEAKVYLTKALELDPENVNALVNMGRLAMDEKRYENADACLRRALELEPACFNALYNLGVLAMEQKRYGDAGTWLKKALDLNPRSFDALYNMGLVALNQGNYEEARGCTEKAVGLNPGDVKALNNLAVCLLYQGQYAEAQRCLRKVIKMDPQHVSAIKNLAGVLAQLGHQEEADGWLKRAAELERTGAGRKE